MRILLLLFFLALSTPAVSAQVPSPSEHLGRPVGGDFTLADWNEVSSYFHRLGEASPRVETSVVGQTTEGRDFLLSVISSEENLGRLERIRALSARLADPRGVSDAERREAIEQGKVLLFISCAMHATETAAPQMAMELAYTLATSDEEPWASARDEVVVLVAPTLNPDGLDHVVSWYRETVGTPYEAASLTKLYQYYAGHDNNRDWFMLTQKETRIVTELLYRVWRPQVYWDVHQQGSTRERIFVPPFRDPLNPNLDPAIIAGIGTLGARALRDMTAWGYSGVSTGVSYDMWWNGGNRNVPVRHNIIGLLTEAASVRVATPVFLPKTDLSGPRGVDGYAPSNRFPDPWPGGWWRLRDIIDYELAFARSLVGSLARERETWLAGAIEAAERGIARGQADAPRAWIVPSDNRDPAACARLFDVLLAAGVELEVADAEFTADGRSYPAGSVLVRAGQPYFAHVQDLFEVQRYPDGAPPYDVAGWTLPLLLGVRRVEVVDALEVPARAARTVEEAVAGFRVDDLSGAAGTFAPSSNSDVWPLVFEELAAGEEVGFVEEGELAGRFLFGEPGEDASARRLGHVPRVGLYSPWSGSMDEGWMRYVFDEFALPFVTVRNEMLRAGKLADFVDVLVLPSLRPGQLDEGREPGSVPERFARGLDPEGAVAVEEFVRGGGRLLCLGGSCRWAIDLLRLPLVDVTREEDQKSFSCPGSVLRGIPEEQALTAGLPASVPLFFSGSSAWREMTKDELREAGLPAEGPGGLESLQVLMRYAPTRTLLSGWMRSPETISDRIAWVRATHGQGVVHLFGFRPQYRGWSQATFPLVFRAAVLDSQ